MTGEFDQHHTRLQEWTRDKVSGLLNRADFNVSGLENLAFLLGTDATAIITFFPHSGHFDSVALRSAVPPELRPTLLHPAAADYWFGGGMKGWLRRQGSPYVVANYPMNRGDSERGSIEESLDQTAEFLELFSIVVAPEGGRSDLPLTKRKLRTGTAELALRTGKPIIPTGLIGLLDVMPKGAFLPKFRENGIPKRIEVVFGKPIVVPEKTVERKRFIEQNLHNQHGEELMAQLKELREQRREWTEKLRIELLSLCGVSQEMDGLDH